MGFPFRDIAKCRLTNIYGKPNKNYSSGKHDGVDLVSDGDKTVLSISNGKVIRSGYSEAWGNYIVIEMQDGRAVVYAHLSSRKVIVGEYVTTGRPIGVMGNTGNSFGAHLHIEIQRQYYKAGRVDDICAFMGIKNITGKVQLIKGVEDVMTVKSIQVEKEGRLINVDSIQHEGHNYIKLRDLEKLADISVGYNAATNRPTIAEKSQLSIYDYAYKQTSGNKVIATHMIRVQEVAPELLKAEVIKGNLNNVKHEFMTNAGYFWWEDSGRKNPYSLSVLVSDGKVLGNNGSDKARGCLIVYNDNTVAVKQVADITKEKNVRFAVGGMTICPALLTSQEGFKSDVLRETSRVVMGWNPDKQKIIIAGYEKMSAVRGRDLLKELGCIAGISLDAGGSALMKESNEYVLKSDGRNQFGCVYLDM